MKNFDLNLIIEWANEINLIDGSNAKNQFLKLSEEIQEVVCAYANYKSLPSMENKISLTEEIGDSIVVIIILSKQCGVDYKILYENASDGTYTPELGLLPILTLSQMGHLARNISRNESVKFNLENLFLFLYHLADYNNIHFNNCIEMAYNKIKDRKGKMINGVFIKEDDLK